MGDSTSYELSWTPLETWLPAPLCGHARIPGKKFCADCGKPSVDRDLDEQIGEYIESQPEGMGYALEPSGSTSDSCKWYEHMEDLAAMSLAIPHVLFHLKGEGEEAGDIWDAFALDGKTQKHAAKVVRVESPDPKAWDTKGST